MKAIATNLSWSSFDSQIDWIFCYLSSGTLRWLPRQVCTFGWFGNLYCWRSTRESRETCFESGNFTPQASSTRVDTSYSELVRCSRLKFSSLTAHRRHRRRTRNWRRIPPSKARSWCRNRRQWSPTSWIGSCFRPSAISANANLIHQSSK